MFPRKVLQCNILAGFSILSVKQPVLPVNCPVQSGSSRRNRRKVYFCIYNNLKKEPFGNIPSSFWKRLNSFSETLWAFLKSSVCFSCRDKLHPPPSLIRSFLLFRSSLHISQNTLAINRLRMTAHPLILLSAVLPESLHKLSSAIPHPKEVTLKVTGLSD